MRSDQDAAITRAGLAAGLLAVAAWSGHFVVMRMTAGAGLRPEDVALIRFATAALVMLPFVVADRGRGLRAIGWRRALALTATAGPLFLLLAAGGFAHAPLAHGAVLQPVATGLGGLVLAWLLLGERPDAARLRGVAVVAAGLVLLNWDAAAAGADAWMGDLMFVAAGALWAQFTILLRRWRIDPVQATAAVALLSAALMLPAVAALSGFERLAAASPSLLAVNVVVQGLLAGAAAVVAYGRAVAALGAARAAMLPALVPGIAMLLGIPLLGEWPSSAQAAGAAVVTTGLLIAFGVLRWPGTVSRIGRERA